MHPLYVAFNTGNNVQLLKLGKDGTYYHVAEFNAGRVDNPLTEAMEAVALLNRIDGVRTPTVVTLKP